MKFKSFVGKKVFAGGKIVEFKDEIYETTKEAEIKALKGAVQVETVEAEEKPAKTTK